MSIRFPILAAAAVGLIVVSAQAHAGRIEALIARSHAADAKGHFDDAAMLMQSAIVADPARAASYVALAELYARHGDAHFAHKYYDEALYLEPTLPVALAGAGRMDLAMGDRKAAAARLDQLKKTCPKCEETKALDAAVNAPEDSQADAASPSMDKP